MRPTPCPKSSAASSTAFPSPLKDSLDTRGIVTTGGTKGRAAYVPPEDATVVRRVRAAGAIVMGKTNTPDLTLAFETTNLVYGRTNNPFDLERTSGGSSGGAAAIVAAGGSPLDIGSDTGGSIRLPSHFCGIVGLKPTAGRVPRTGHIIDYRGVSECLTHIGPLARRVEDLALVLGVIAGPDGVDPHVVPAPLGDPGAVKVAGLRIAHFTRLPPLEPTAETANAVLKGSPRAGAGGGSDLCPWRDPGFGAHLRHLHEAPLRRRRGRRAAAPRPVGQRRVDRCARGWQG